MSYKGHIVKNPSGVTERQKYRKGNVERESLIFLKLERHPLRGLDDSIKLSTHHIISVKSTETLSKARRDLLEYKAYNVNHPKNLVTLPTEKKVCCHYRIPRHASGHTGKKIVTDYKFDESSEVKKLTELHDNETDSVSKSEATISDDMHRFNELFAYHKICRLKLSTTIKFKKLNCTTKPEKVVNAIDELSSEILMDISYFKLNLFNNGRFYKDGESGCKQSDSTKCHRNHQYPKLNKSDIFFPGSSIVKRVYDLKDKFDFQCEAPINY